jgi:hypothetical protein
MLLAHDFEKQQKYEYPLSLRERARVRVLND